MNNETNQTPVEWLETQIQDLIPNDIGSQLKFKNKIKQAKEMDKERIIEFGCLITSGTEHEIEHAYNEIYGGGAQ